MIATNTSANINKVGRRKDVFITLFLALYISFFYLPTSTFPESIARVVLYSCVAITVIKIIIRQTPLKITSHSVWFFSFGMLGLVSSLYASARAYVFSDLYTLLIAGVLSFSFIQYVQDVASFKRLFSFYAYAPCLLAIYLLITGLPSIQGERLGDNLFGNANRIATYLMLSLFCLSWFILYFSRKYLIVNVVLALITLYMTALTGGRKYLIVPLLFFLLLVILKNWRNNKPGLVLYLFIFMLVSILGFWALLNIPALYYSVGVRFEGLLDIFKGDLANPDASSIVRLLMIETGWNWFLQRPLLGYGLNNFAYLFSQILFNAYAHNNYIEMLVDLGIIGFLVYYSFYAYIIVKLFGIQDDVTGLRNFFLAFIIALLVFEIGGITYQYTPVQVFIGLVATYVWLYKRGKI